MRHTVIFTIILFFAGLAWSEEPREIVIFHTNDIHGHFLPTIEHSGKDSSRIGGVDALSGYLSKYRSEFPNSIYLDAGDLMTGNPVCNVDYDGVKGGALLELMRRLNVTAECLGNHEFDLGPEHLRQYVRTARYSLLSANVEDRSSGKLLAPATKILEVNGVKIGVIGLMMDDLAGVTSKANIEPFQIDDIAATAQKYIDELDPQTDLVILLTHNGLDEDELLAKHIKNADIIVGGHSHTPLEKPETVNGVVIVQAGCYCAKLGVLDVKVAGDSVQSFNGRLVNLYADSVHADPRVASLADSLGGVIQSEYGSVIGTLKNTWKRSYYECSNVGNWICDHLREHYKTDIALVNAGGIRADINSGPIRKRNILELLPFTNTVVTFEATGRDIETLAEVQANAQGKHSHGILEMSGINITYKKHGEKIEAVKVTINGKPPVPDKVYRVASIDYVAASQTDRYLGFAPKHINFTSDLISDAMIDEIQKSKAPIESDPTNRLMEIR